MKTLIKILTTAFITGILTTSTMASIPPDVSVSQCESGETFESIQKDFSTPINGVQFKQEVLITDQVVVQNFIDTLEDVFGPAPPDFGLDKITKIQVLGAENLNTVLIGFFDAQGCKVFHNTLDRGTLEAILVVVDLNGETNP